MNQRKQFIRVARAGVFGIGFFASAGAMAANGAAIRADVLYHEYCSVCHGDRGDGSSKAMKSLNPPPRDLTKLGAMPKEYLEHVIGEGKPGTAMVGYKTRLDKEQIAALADYVHTAIVNRGAAIAAGQIGGISGTSGTQGTGGSMPVSPGAAAPASVSPSAAPIPPVAAPIPERKAVTADERADMKLSFPEGLKGDAEKGKAFYMANCAECHGTKGDGQGPRAYFIRPVPRNFMDERSRATLNRPAIYAATYFGRLGTEMPAWSKVISNQEIANVSEFVFQSFISTGQKTAAKAK